MTPQRVLPHRHRAVASLAVVLVLTGGASAAATQTVLRFRTYADTGIRLTHVLWTGERFLYVENTANTVWSAPPAGAPLTKLASMPKKVEETRCLVSPGRYGFRASDIFCHSPANTIYELSTDGRKVTVFARLPESSTSDGALAFDTGGRFGHVLLAVTGRSGGAAARGGVVYAITPRGGVTRVGSYAGPGGADEAAVAPAAFGTAAGDLLLTIDAGKQGRVVAIDPAGRARTLATLPDGPNPIAVVATSGMPAGAAPPGLYVTDTLSRKLFYLPAAQLTADAGDVIVGSELKALFWLLRPAGGGFRARLLPTNLGSGSFNLEGATYVAP